jgi:membrane protein
MNVKSFLTKLLVKVTRPLKKIKLPLFEGLTLYQVLRFFYYGVQKGALNMRASAISFQIILALAPTFILLLSLIPYIPIDNFQENLLLAISNALPPGTYNYIEHVLLDLIKSKHSTVLSISFLLGVYYASNSVNALLQGLTGSYNLTQKVGFLKQRLYSIILVIFLPLFLGSAFLTQALSSKVLKYLQENELLMDGVESIVVYGVKWFTVIFLFLIGISTLYNIANRDRKKWKFISAGASFATLAVIIVSQGFAWYVNNFAQFNKFYGSLATVVILLLWIQFNNVLLLLGFELNTSISRARKEHN